MNWNFIFIHVLISFSRCNIQYASGNSSYWYNVNCKAGVICTQTITFSQQFSRIPQVSINPHLMQNYWNTTLSEIGFDLSVSTITTSNFIVNLKAQVQTINYLTFYWIAVDDKRVEILNNFNVVNATSTVLPHNNANANTGIIFFTSFYAKIKIDFTLTWGHQLYISRSKHSPNKFEKFRIYVILGPAEFFDIEAQISGLPKDESDSAVYKSRQVPIEANKVLLFFMQYFTFTVNRDLMFEFLAILEPTYYQYRFCTWGSGSSQSFTAAAHQCATLKFVLPNLKPIIFHKLRTSSLISLEQTNIELSIPQFSKTYVSLVNNDQIIVPNNFQSLAFNLKIRCNKNFTIKVQFYQCDSPCLDQYKKVVRYCYNLGITFQFFLTYNIQDVGKYQYLNVFMTTSQIQIFQTLLNQVSTQVLICQFDLL